MLSRFSEGCGSNPSLTLPKQARYKLRYTRIFCLAVWKHRLGNIIIYAAKDCKYPIKYVMMLFAR